VTGIATAPVTDTHSAQGGECPQCPSAQAFGQGHMVAGGRFALYSEHLIQIQAVAASIDVPVDLRTNGFLKKVERDGPHYEH
jgi:hypothetical protein